ncbi:MAG: hypothetical protein KGY66_02630 [Candidatus Thermoplasmatota archaeon]|nr:hypothetical protein [Candidatus Thermoplasmatota archaeon]MBS3789789.1 hypothetical protein [Candidatus Thermoplasmatota archaeon]
MKIKKMVDVLQKYDDGDITEKEALEELKDAESFDFYAATLELYQKGVKLEKGDSPKISKLFKDLYQEDFSLLIHELEKDHPIKRLILEHEKFEKLLDKLDTINREIKEKSTTEDVMKVSTIAMALKHLNEHFLKEEETIFRLWYEKRGMADLHLLEDEHKDISKSHKRLLEKSRDKNEEWEEEDWINLSEMIEEIIGKIHFHVFHEGDIFYPIVVDEFDHQEFEEIKKKMDDIEKQNSSRSLSEYIRDLNLSAQ